MGDVVLSTPVIRALRVLYPDAFIAFMVRPENRDLVAYNEDLDEVIIYDKYGAHKSFLRTANFAMKLRKKRFDTAIALHPTNRVHLMFFLAGIERRIGYDRKLPFLLNRIVPHEKQRGSRHEVEYNLQMITQAGLGTPPQGIRPYINTGENEQKMIDAAMRTCGIKRPFLALHAGASCPSKRWDSLRFARAADEIASKHDLDVVLVGGDETSKISEDVSSAMKMKAVDLTGMLLLGELAELLSRSRLFISNDSGPVHVAAAMGTPVISIFGRKDPGLSPLRWAPYSDRSRVLHGDAGCRVCYAHECKKGYECLDLVTVQQVVEASDELLSPDKGGRTDRT
jgi:lipopolysaccharide heptosyltransferase II